MRAGFRVSCRMLLVIVLGVLGLGCAQDSGFADVSPDEFYSEAVEALASDGVFDDTGCGDGSTTSQPRNPAHEEEWG